MADISKLEQQESFADEYGDRIAEWELFAVALVCKELGRIGKMTPEQAKKYDAEKETKKTELQIRNQELQHEKSEAIKEFAERLKEKLQWDVEFDNKLVFESDIDNLVKEMTDIETT